MSKPVNEALHTQQHCDLMIFALECFRNELACSEWEEDYPRLPSREDAEKWLQRAFDWVYGLEEQLRAEARSHSVNSPSLIF